MNQTPIVLLVGPAGSGKDTVASFLVKNHHAVAVAQADPMKRIAAAIFGFTKEQLWGPSEMRNAADVRFDSDVAWRLSDEKAMLAQLVLAGDLGVVGAEQRVKDLFCRWYEEVRHQCHPDTAHRRPLTPRYVLQTLGTEFGRYVDLDLWSNIAVRTAKRLLAGGYEYDRTKGLFENSSLALSPERVVITDGRFRNEVLNVRYINGEVVHIVNNTNTEALARAVDAAGVANHKSEAEMKTIPDHFFTTDFFNDKAAGLRVCEDLVRDMVRSWENTYSCFDSRAKR